MHKTSKISVYMLTSLYHTAATELFYTFKGMGYWKFVFVKLL